MGIDFAEAFRDALADTGMSLVHVRKQLNSRGVRVSLSTLSYWKSGARRPDPNRAASTVSALEEVLGVRAGTLNGSISGRSRRLGSVGSVERWAEPGHARGDLRVQLGATDPANFRFLSIQEVIDVDDQLRVSAIATDLIVQCVREHVQSLAFMDAIAGERRVLPRLQVEGGGRLVRSVRDANDAMFGFRIDLDRVIERGETAMLSFTIAYAPGQTRREHSLSVSRRTREIVQWYRFGAGREPEWFEEEERTRAQTRWTASVLDPRSVHRLRENFGPGEVRAQWGALDDF